MSPGTKLSQALRRMGSAVGARLVREDDAVRTVRHDGPVADLNSRMVKFAAEVEDRAITIERGR